jgi:hypothetical protein
VPLRHKWSANKRREIVAAIVIVAGKVYLSGEERESLCEKDSTLGAKERRA